MPSQAANAQALIDRLRNTPGYSAACARPYLSQTEPKT